MIPLIGDTMKIATNFLLSLIVGFMSSFTRIHGMHTLKNQELLATSAVHLELVRCRKHQLAFAGGSGDVPDCHDIERRYYDEITESEKLKKYLREKAHMTSVRCEPEVLTNLRKH